MFQIQNNYRDYIHVDVRENTQYALVIIYALLVVHSFSNVAVTRKHGSRVD